jgi:hypothetical protein
MMLPTIHLSFIFGSATALESGEIVERGVARRRYIADM